jgi:uncharacterized protein YdaU (DUF1376 family)
MTTRSKCDNWMPLWIADYLADTHRLDTTQHGAYLLLIMDYWRNGPPPNDNSVLARIVRTSPDEWTKLRPTVETFFQLDNGAWHHKRIDSELEIARFHKQSLQSISAKGVAARRALGQLPKQPTVQPSVQPTVEPSVEPLVEPLHHHHHSTNTTTPTPSPKTLSPNVQSIQNQTELKRVEARMEFIRSRATTTATGKIFSQPQIVELSQLKNRHQQLLEALKFIA